MNKLTLLPYFLLCCICGSAFSFVWPWQETVKDKDGNSYKIVKIGNQEWMAENLRVKTEGSVCYENDPKNCKKNGRLYTWAEALNLPQNCNNDRCMYQVRYPHQGICPDGFHVPTTEEFDSLFNFVGSQKPFTVGGIELRPVGSYIEGKFSTESYLWTTGENLGPYLQNSEGYIYHADHGWFLGGPRKTFAGSLRCLKNYKSSDKKLIDFNGNSYDVVKIGSQVWQAQNMRAKTQSSLSPSPALEKYGRLYQPHDAMKLCPEGWRLPSSKDYKILLSNLQKLNFEKSDDLKTKTKGFLETMPGYYYDNEDRLIIPNSDNYRKQDISAYFWTFEGQDIWGVDISSVYTANIMGIFRMSLGTGIGGRFFDNEMLKDMDYADSIRVRDISTVYFAPYILLASVRCIKELK